MTDLWIRPVGKVPMHLSLPRKAALCSGTSELSRLTDIWGIAEKLLAL